MTCPTSGSASRADTFIVQSFAAEQVIFHQGELGDAAFMLERGKVSMRQLVDGHLTELDVIMPGEIFGEMAVLTGGPRMAYAVALDNCQVTRIPAASFAVRMQEADPFLRGVIHKFIKDIRASYRAFLRRPRSLRDHVRQVEGLLGNVRRYAARLHAQDPALASKLNARTNRLLAELSELNALVAECPEQRRDIILDDAEVLGVPFRSVVDSEDRRGSRIDPAAHS